MLPYPSLSSNPDRKIFRYSGTVKESEATSVGWQGQGVSFMSDLICDLKWSAAISKHLFLFALFFQSSNSFFKLSFSFTKSCTVIVSGTTNNLPLLSW